MTGRVFAVVGPSGAGKDTLIEAARTQRPDLVVVRRTITRPETAGGEEFDGVTEAEFDRLKGLGTFALDWRAHGLRYGIPRLPLDLRHAGRTVLFNGSRAALDRALVVMPDLVVIRVCAPSSVLADRLMARGRETRDQIEARLVRASYDVPAHFPLIDVRNDGPLADGIARFLTALQPVNA
jgi:ribose 1,5-bisphosphokinase